MYAENKIFGEYEYSKLLLTFAVSIEPLCDNQYIY